MRVSSAAALLALALAGCGGGAEEQAPTPAATPTLDAGPRTLVPADLALDSLGPRIEGPQGDEVESDLPDLGTMVSFVACPGDVDAQECDPAALPDDTIYTYVHRITLDPAEGEQAEEEFAGARVFRTTMPAPGFANVIGFARDQAAETLGEQGDIKVQVDNGQLIWRIAAGDGWMPGETLTLFWQSTSPPAGPQEAYLLEAEGADAEATGPFPAAENGEDAAGLQ